MLPSSFFRFATKLITCYMRYIIIEQEWYVLKTTWNKFRSTGNEEISGLEYMN